MFFGGSISSNSGGAITGSSSTPSYAAQISIAPKSPGLFVNVTPNFAAPNLES